jgi:DNA-binding winged helix-turn-helix (wHTH) protein/TolB-like protein
MNTQPKKIREFGKFRLDIEQKILWHSGKTVAMPLKELEVLCLLVENDGRLVTKNELVGRLWADSFVGENNLSRHIYLLRKMLADFGADKNLIKNIPRRGYRFTGEVREVPLAEFIVERHTRTQTVIEFEEREKGRKEETEKKTLFLKLFSSPLLLFSLSLLLAAGAFFGYQKWAAAAAAPEIKSIAVLPFKTIDADPENEHRGLGLTDILITRLSNIRELTVRPTNAVLSLENADSILAGQKLNADAVLEGAVYRVGDKVRVTARLVRVADGTTIWNGQFEKLRVDEMRLQDEIALQITEVLRLNLNSTEKNALTKRLTKNPDAFELYQKGRYEWNKRSWAGMIEAERLFRNAIDRDPEFALAYTGLADTMVTQSNRMETELAILKALEIDPDLAEAHASLGFFRIFHQWNWPAAEESLKKSIALNPNYATAYHWYAQVLTIQGRHEEAKAAMRRALEINPLSHNFLADLGQIYYCVRPRVPGRHLSENRRIRQSVRRTNQSRSNNH